MGVKMRICVPISGTNIFRENVPIEPTHSKYVFITKSNRESSSV